MFRPLLIVLAACTLLEAGWSLTPSKDRLSSATDGPSSPEDHVPSPTHRPNLSDDSLDQPQPANASRRGLDSKRTERPSYLDPCHSVGYNRRCSGGQSLTCEGHSTFLYCGLGEVLVIQSAVYGRRDAAECSRNRPWSQISNTNCATHSTANGRRTCSVRADNNMFGDPLRKYLTATYSCQRQSATCEWRAASLSCDAGKALTIIAAVYGRQNTETCSLGRPWSQIENTQCATCATSEVAEICGGRRTCSFQAANSLFGDPCVGTYKYLMVTYSCD